MCQVNISSPIACAKCKSVVYCSRACRENDAIHKDHLCQVVATAPVGVMIGAASDSSQLASLVGDDSVCDKLVNFGDAIDDPSASPAERETASSWIGALWSYLHDMMRNTIRGINNLRWQSIVRSGSVPAIAAVTESLAKLSYSQGDPEAGLLSQIINQLVPIYDWLIELLGIEQNADDAQLEVTLTAVTGSRAEVSALRRILDATGAMAARVIRFMLDAVYSAMRRLSEAVFIGVTKTSEFVGNLVGWSARFVDTESSLYARMAQFAVFIQQVPQLMMTLLDRASQTMGEVAQDLAAYVANFIEDIVRPKLVPLMRDRTGRGDLDKRLAANSFWTDLFGTATNMLGSAVGVPIAFLWSAVSTATAVTYTLMSSVLQGVLGGIQAFFSEYIAPRLGTVSGAMLEPTNDEIEGSAQVFLNGVKAGTIKAARKADMDKLESQLKNFRDLKARVYPNLDARLSAEGGAIGVVGNKLRGAWKASKMFVEFSRTGTRVGTEADDVFVMQHLHGSTRGNAKQFEDVRQALLRTAGTLWTGALSAQSPETSGWMTDVAQPISFVEDESKSVQQQPVGNNETGDGGQSTKKKMSAQELIAVARAQSAAAQPGQNLTPDSGALAVLQSRAATRVATRPLYSPVEAPTGQQLAVDGKRYYVLGDTENEPPMSVNRIDLIVLNLRRANDRAVHVDLLTRIASRTPEGRKLIGITPIQNKAYNAISQLVEPVIQHTILARRGAYTYTKLNYLSWLASLAINGVFYYLWQGPMRVDLSYGFNAGTFVAGGSAVFQSLNRDAKMVSAIYDLLGNDDLRAKLMAYAGENAASAPGIYNLITSWNTIQSASAVSATWPLAYLGLETHFATVAGAAPKLSEWLQAMGLMKDTISLSAYTTMTDTGYVTATNAATGALKASLTTFGSIATAIIVESRGILSVNIGSAREAFSAVAAPSTKTLATRVVDWINSSSVGEMMTGGFNASFISDLLFNVIVPGLAVTLVFHFLVDIVYMFFMEDQEKKYKEAVASKKYTYKELAEMRTNAEFFSVRGISGRVAIRVALGFAVASAAFDIRVAAATAIGGGLLQFATGDFAKTAMNFILPGSGTIVGAVTGDSTPAGRIEPGSGPVIEEIQ